MNFLDNLFLSFPMKHYEEKPKEELINELKSAAGKPTVKNCYETAISVTGNIFYEWDMVSDEVVYDGNLEKIIGFSADEMAGSMKRWIALIHHDDVKCFNEIIKTNIATKEPVQLKYRIRKKSGGYMQVHDNIRFFSDTHDNHVRMVGFVNDVSVFKDQQAGNLNFLKKTLMEFTHEINNSVGVVFICVKEVKRLFTQLLRANTSTDTRFDTINDKLQALRKLVDENSLYSDKWIGDKPDVIDELYISFEELRKTIDGVSRKGTNILDYLEDTMNVSLRCKNLIKSLVGFMNQSESVKTRYKINNVIKKIIELYEYQAGTKQIDICCTYDPAIPDILMDVNQIELVIANIINNAFQAIEESQKNKFITEMQRVGVITIETHFFREKNVVEVVIMDSGSGIAKDYLPKVFDPFFSKFKKKTGTGIGLSIAYKIVHMHNGTIEVESMVGKGTTFRITLPLDNSS
ncbi:MAG: PAS domain-containing protein [Candidatus Kuenenia sp.]|nr:PAS domain-containing protein [Candidatus Kuenenia hertensis]